MIWIILHNKNVKSENSAVSRWFLRSSVINAYFKAAYPVGTIFVRKLVSFKSNSRVETRRDRTRTARGHVRRRILSPGASLVTTWPPRHSFRKVSRWQKRVLAGISLSARRRNPSVSNLYCHSTAVASAARRRRPTRGRHRSLTPSYNSLPSLSK